MAFDPASINFDRLFTDESMFDSRKAWRRAGFDVFDPGKDTEVMVAAHGSAPGYLFKKYADDVGQTEQQRNYKARVEGAEKLARFVAQQQLGNIVVPRKHLYELPRDIFGRKSLLVVVERLDLVGRDESEACFRKIEESLLREVLRVIAEFPGLDSNSKNIQFTRDGKVAFVDLENYKRADRKTVRLKSIGTYLSKDGRKLATKIFDDLNG